MSSLRSHLSSSTARFRPDSQARFSNLSGGGEPTQFLIALPKGSKTPRLDYPPLKAYRFSDAALIAGAEIHHIDNVAVRIFSPEKTLADCFKFRNKLGMDIVLEALKLYKTRKNFDLENLMKYAGVCRVENVMRPYLEAML